LRVIQALGLVEFGCADTPLPIAPAMPTEVISPAIVRFRKRIATDIEECSACLARRQNSFKTRPHRQIPIVGEACGSIPFRLCIGWESAETLCDDAAGFTRISQGAQ
jgi:hypothetical protein